MNGIFRHLRVAAIRSRFTFRWFFSLALISMSLLQTGCGTQKNSHDMAQIAKAKDVYQQALTNLETAHYAKAAIGFSKILDENPDDTEQLYYNSLVKLNPELLDQARFGFVISNVLAKINDAVTSVAQVLGAVMPMIGGSPSAAEIGFTPRDLAAAMESPQFNTMGSLGIESVLDDLIANIRDFIMGSLDTLAKIKKNPDFKMSIDPLPVKFLNINIMQIGGEYDLGEVYFFLSIGSIIASVLDGVRAIDLNIGISTITSELLPYLKVLPDNAFKIEQLPNTLMNLVPVLLHLEPNLFGVQDKNLVIQGADEMADGAGYFQQMVEAIRSDVKTDPNQSDDLIGYVVVDGVENMEFHYKIEIAVPGVSLKDFEGLRVEIRDDVNNAVDNIKSAFRGRGTGIVEWARDIVPLISLAVVTVLRTGALNGLIQAAMETKGGTSSKSSPILDIINSPIITPDVIGGLITEFIPDVFRFNVKAYLNEPKGGLRTIFPLWTMPQDHTNDSSRIQKQETIAGETVETTLFHPFRQIRFIYEYECINKNTGKNVDHIADGTFICDSKTDATRDRAPFSALTAPTVGMMLTDATATAVTNEIAFTSSTSNVTFQIYSSAGTDPLDWAFVVPVLDGDTPDWLFSDPKYDAWFGVNSSLGVTYETLYTRKNFVNEHRSKTVDYNKALTEAGPGVTDYGLKKDGMASVLPYFAFQDASMGGLIEYNFASADLSKDAENQLSDLMDWTGPKTSLGALDRALNALIALVGEKVGGLLSSF